MYRFISLFFILFAALLSIANAESEIPLEDVVVSAYKMDMPIGQSASASVITRKDLEKGGYAFAVDALQTVPGLMVTQNGALGGTASVFVRGAKTGNMVVLIDGVKVNDPSTIERTYDFGTLTTDSIERIEIVKGPQSVLYGSDATGGIINIVTKKGQGKATATIAASGGSFYTNQLSANVAGRESSFHYSLTLGQIASQGYSRAAKPDTAKKPFDDDGFYQRFAAGRFGLNPFDSLNIDLGFTAKQTDLDLDDGAFQDDPNSFENRKEFSGYLRATHAVADFWKHSITVDGSQTKRRYDDFDDDGSLGFDDSGMDSSYTGTMAHGEWLHTFTVKDLTTLLVGASFDKEKYRFDDELNDTSLKKDAWTAGFFAQDHLSIAKMLYVTAGARADKHEVFGWQQSYTASSAIVVPVVQTKLKGNWGKGYRAPSLYQIYGDGGVFVKENKDLKPEENTGFDAGIEQPIFNIATVSVSYFANRYRNMIVANSSFPSKYINVGRVKTSGYEAAATVKPIEFIAITSGYTYLKAIDEDKDEQLLRRPKHQAFASVSVSVAKLTVSCTGSYIGKRNDSYYDSTSFKTVKVENESYVKADIAAQYALTPQLTITAKAENITNKEYQQVVGYAMPGRSFYAGVKGVF